MMQHTGYFLFHKSFLPTLVRYLNKNIEHNKNLTVVTIDQTVVDYLKQTYHVQCVHIDDYFSTAELEQFNRDAIDWLLHWSQSKIANDKSIAEYFKFDDTSLWWVSGYLYVYGDVINLISTSDKIDNIIALEKFDKIILPDVHQRKSLTSQLSLSDNNYPYKILSNICHLKKIPMEFIRLSGRENLKWRIQFLKNRLSTFVFEHFYLLLMGICRKFLAKQKFPNSYLKNFINSGARKIVLLSPSRNWGDVFDLKHFQKVNGDAKIGYLYQKLSRDKSNILLGLDCNSLPSAEFKIFKKKLIADPFLKWCSLEYFVDLKTCFWSHRAKKKYQNKALKLLKDSDFKKSFFYKGIDFYNILEPRIKFIFRTMLPHGAVTIKSYENFCNKVQPDLLIATYETGFHGRAAISACWKSNIPVLAIQHGKIHPSHPQYIHLKTSTREAPDICYTPIADMTCVFGDYTRKVLTEDSAYPSDKICITGQIPTDAFKFADQLYDVSQFKKSYQLVSDLPTICLMSQNFDTEIDYEKLYKISCEGLNSFAELNFIVKLHPREVIDEAKTLVKKYYKNYHRVNVLKSVDLYEIIFNSDIVITGNSTVGLEAMIFKKPLITIEGFKYSMGYAESGASIGVTSVAEMQDALEKVLHDPSTKKKLINKGQQYLQFHLYKIDGYVSERIIDKGNELIKGLGVSKNE